MRCGLSILWKTDAHPPNGRPSLLKGESVPLLSAIKGGICLQHNDVKTFALKRHCCCHATNATTGNNNYVYQNTYSPWPTAVRITMRLHDPRNVIEGGRVFQFVVPLPKQD